MRYVVQQEASPNQWRDVYSVDAEAGGKGVAVEYAASHYHLLLTIQRDNPRVRVVLRADRQIRIFE